VAGSVGTLSAKLVLNGQDFTLSLEKAKKELGSFESSIAKVGSLSRSALGAIGVGVGIGALGSAIKSALDDTGRLVDVSSKLDIGVGKLQQMELAAKTSGASAESLHNAINKLQQKLGEASGGSEEARKDFERLGLNWRQLAAQGADVTFEQVAEKIGSMTDAYARAEGAQSVFGKGGKELIPLMREFTGELQLAKEALGNLMTDKEAQKLDEIGDKFERLKARMGNVFKRAIVESVENPLSILAPLAATGLEGISFRGPVPGKGGQKAPPAGPQLTEITLFTKAIEKHRQEWEKWSRDAVRDARRPFEVMLDKLQDVRSAFKMGVVDQAGFDKAVGAMSRQLTEGLTTPLQAMRRELGELGQLVGSGLLTMGQFTRLRGKSVLDLGKQVGDITNRNETGFAAAGSTDAVSAINRQINDAMRPQEGSLQHIQAVLQKANQLHQQTVDLQQRAASALERIGAF
jgi:hypothetical protein